MDQLYLHGGAEKIVSLKLNSFASIEANKVFLVTTEQMNNAVVYPLDERVELIDLSINYDRKVSYFHPRNLIKSLKHFLKLRRKISELNGDVIISVSQTPDQYFLPFIDRTVPKVKEFHSSGYASLNFTKKGLKAKLFNTYEKYDSLVVLNKDESQYYPFDNVSIIPNFISQNSHNKPVDSGIRKRRIIAAGRVAEVKQFDHLIDAWSLLFEKYVDWSVEIYGDGEKDFVRNINNIIDAKSVKNISLMGATPELNRVMTESSVFAMTSSTECFPMVLLEAMSNGLPIISYDCPHGPRNIINKNTGVLIDRNNPIKFAEGISLLIDNNENRESMAMRAKLSVEDYSEDIVMNKWRALFSNLRKEVI
jgi:glycosyltransferase involved in cell wall biosynthesis|tara:strand:+ start:302 stop:1396 length:1095 start_codon:yes stop_codon:yes gene_type:complete